MKLAFLDACVVATAALVALAPDVAGADSKTAPYYATPSWDQQLPGSERFVLLPNWVDANFPSGGAAVLDKETGLVWERSPDTSQLLWQDAQPHCTELFAGNRLGWRLPTVQELASLVDRTVASGVALPSGHPFINVQADFYWSATTYALFPSLAWNVDLASGIVGTGVGASDKSVVEFIWCVRGGQGGDPQ